MFEGQCVRARVGKRYPLIGAIIQIFPQCIQTTHDFETRNRS